MAQEALGLTLKARWNCCPCAQSGKQDIFVMQMSLCMCQPDKAAKQMGQVALGHILEARYFYHAQRPCACVRQQGEKHMDVHAALGRTLSRQDVINMHKFLCAQSGSEGGIQADVATLPKSAFQRWQHQLHSKKVQASLTDPGGSASFHSFRYKRVPNMESKHGHKALLDENLTLVHTYKRGFQCFEIKSNGILRSLEDELSKQQ
eukprot:1142168-Pelagomonas_calceolata.AAC.7